MLKKVLRWGGLTVLVLFLGIQLKQPDRSNPPVVTDVGAPAEVQEILRRSCYDCHSHETRWPWYSYVAPVSWYVADDVEEARGDLNFSDWPVYDLEELEHTLEEIREEIEEGEMPLPNYLRMHPEARLSEADKETLLRWASP